MCRIDCGELTHARYAPLRYRFDPHARSNPNYGRLSSFTAFPLLKVCGFRHCYQM